MKCQHYLFINKLESDIYLLHLCSSFLFSEDLKQFALFSTLPFPPSQQPSKLSEDDKERGGGGQGTETNDRNIEKGEKINQETFMHPLEGYAVFFEL